MIEAFLACALALNDIGCADPATAAPALCPYRSDSDNDAIESVCLAQMRSIARRAGDELILSLDQGTRAFRDDLAACEQVPLDFERCRSHRIGGYLPRSRLYVVATWFYEGGETRIVSRRTGAELRLEAAPLPSPGESYLAVCLSDDLNGTEYGVEIYRTGDDLPRLEFRHIVPPSAYAFFTCDSWTTSSELQITMETDLGPPVRGQPNMGHRSHRLRRIDGTWAWDVEPVYVHRTNEP